jgi:hypothetical protein
MLKELAFFEYFQCETPFSNTKDQNDKNHNYETNYNDFLKNVYFSPKYIGSK